MGTVSRSAALVLLAVVLLGTVGIAGAHETETVDGYELTFGGSDEPVITDERMWLEVSIVAVDTGEPVEGLEDDLSMAVQRPFGSDTVDLEVSSRFGEPGVYEAAIVFTEPGTYTVYVNGTVDGTAIDTSFQTPVHDVDDLRYPTPTPESDLAGGLPPATGFGLGAVVAVVGMGVAFAIGRRWSR